MQKFNFKQFFTKVDIDSRHGKFNKPPTADNYAVYFDDYTTDGDDFNNRIKNHSVTIELYEKKQNDDIENAFETELNRYITNWSKIDRVWIESEQIYQVVYTFDYSEKI